MIRDIGPAGPLLIAIAWASAANGGTSGRDLALISFLVLFSTLVATGGQLRALSTPVPLLAALGLLGSWLIGSGVIRSGLNLVSLRVPVLCLIAFLTVQAVRLLDDEQRGRLLRGLIVLGTIHATTAIAEALAHLAAGSTVLPPRVDGLMGNANALGIFLVATAVLTVRELTLGRTRLLVAPLALQAVALLLTGSRLAIIVALCWVGCFLTVRGSWRCWLAVMPWAVAAGVIVAVRFWGTESERLDLALAALRQLAERPLAGRGPGPTVLDVPSSEALPTTHAHNEALQLAVEYGLVGLALAIGVLVLALLSRPRVATLDRWVAAAAVSLLAGGLTDFSLRISAIVVTAAALAAVALIPPRCGEDAPGSQLWRVRMTVG